MLALIAAYAENRIIGNHGKIPWDIPEEKHRFRDLTMGHWIIMGRRTYEEIGFPLPGRESIVISNTKNFDQPHCITVSSLTEALALTNGQDAFICGGAALYQEALPLADVLYLTEIHHYFEGDTVFPAFDPSDFIQTEQITITGAKPYTFFTLKRKDLTYQQARDYIAGLTAQKGIILGLEPMKAVLEKLGNPQNQYPIIHIAGTNGKGSILQMISSILQAAGYCVGSYASPAVFDERECWQINGTYISQDAYAHYMTRLQGICRMMQRQQQATPTAFELETILAFWWLAEQNCDVAVIECGMGGRDDATNIISSTAVSVISSIALDHMKFLGDSLEKIAYAKGGIIKPQVPTVLQGQEKTVEQEISRICTQQHSALTIVQPDDISLISADETGILFDYQEMKQISVSLPGRMQAYNAATAIEAVRHCSPFAVSEQAIREGLQQVIWHGRLEQISSNPVIVIDGAHNPNAAGRLREEAERRWKIGSVIEIIGVLADKDFAEVGRLMAPMARKIITITPHNPRALQAEQLAECFSQFCENVTAAASVQQALQLALQEADTDTPILAFGSFSWLHELKEAVEEQR